jgi:hypothetical protein
MRRKPPPAAEDNTWVYLARDVVACRTPREAAGPGRRNSRRVPNLPGFPSSCSSSSMFERQKENKSRTLSARPRPLGRGWLWTPPLLRASLSAYHCVTDVTARGNRSNPRQKLPVPLPSRPITHITPGGRSESILTSRPSLEEDDAAGLLGESR